MSFAGKWVGTGGHHVEQDKRDTERQVLYVFSQMLKLKRKLICK
jgi:hypothetical protein